MKVIELCLLALFIGSCTTAPFPALKPTTPPPTPYAYQPGPGVPVNNAYEAERFAKSFVDAETRIWLPHPQLFSVRQMDLATAIQQAGIILNGKYQNIAPDTQVWLVILRGRYQVLPPGTSPTPGADREGCVWVVFTSVPESNTTGVAEPRECP